MIGRRLAWVALALLAFLAQSAGMASDGQPVRGCGYVTDEGGCLHIVVPGFGSYQMVDIGAPGDTVFVWGTTDPDQQVTCPEADAWLYGMRGSCRLTDYGCGVLVDCGEDPGTCVCLSKGDGWLRLLAPTEYEVGDSVRVAGVRLCCAYGWCVEDSFILAQDIVPCDSMTAVSGASWGSIKSIFRWER